MEEENYQRLPAHTLEQSPCYPIIITIVKEECGRRESYLCKLHCYQGYSSTGLDTIEYHCKTNDPQLHKAEIIRLLKEEEEAEVATATITTSNNNIPYSQIILRNILNNQMMIIDAESRTI
jgi:hypothetical protein